MVDNVSSSMTGNRIHFESSWSHRYFILIIHDGIDEWDVLMVMKSNVAFNAGII